MIAFVPKFWFRSYLLLGLALIASCSQKADQSTHRQTNEQITFREKLEEDKVDVLVGEKLFTSYRWPPNVYKPILWPILSAGGSTITRGFPLEPREGESKDHMHQVGNWLNYGNVNGFDFWGNGHTGERSPKGGEIRHIGIEKKTEGPAEASLVTSASWVDPDGTELMKEKTTFHFMSRGQVRIIDRVATLWNTSGKPVVFKDTKEGMFGLRVARPLELPAKDEETTNDAAVHASLRAHSHPVTGNYRSSEGVTGEAVWGTRARWMDLYGKIGEEKVSVVICDHPKNISYPTWWHARGYGLFSANPLGAKDFTDGKQELNFSLPPGDSIAFRYRIIVASGEYPTDQEVNRLADEFEKLY